MIVDVLSSEGLSALEKKQHPLEETIGHAFCQVGRGPRKFSLFKFYACIGPNWF